MQTDFQHVATSFVRLHQRMQRICETSLWNWRLNSAVCSILVLFVCKSKVPKCLCHYAVQSPCCCVTKGGGISEFLSQIYKVLLNLKFCNFCWFIKVIYQSYSLYYYKLMWCICQLDCIQLQTDSRLTVYHYFDTFDRVTHKWIYNLFIHVRKKIYFITKSVKRHKRNCVCCVVDTMKVRIKISLHKSKLVC